MAKGHGSSRNLPAIPQRSSAGTIPKEVKFVQVGGTSENKVASVLDSYKAFLQGDHSAIQGEGHLDALHRDLQNEYDYMTGKLIEELEKLGPYKMSPKEIAKERKGIMHDAKEVQKVMKLEKEIRKQLKN